jgi:hypothetical protein
VDTAIAGRLVAELGGRFSRELGIDLDRGGEEIERWALAATLFGNRISTRIALRTYGVLERAGVRTLGDAWRRTWDELVALLDEGGYVRYDFRTASRLLALARYLDEHCDGRIATLGERHAESAGLARALDALPGWGPVTVQAFLRELRGVWPGAEPPLDTRAQAAARHLGLPAEIAPLRDVAAGAGLDVRDLEAALVRLALSHDLARCPGGAACTLGRGD